MPGSSPTLACPTCSTPFPADDVNVGANVAFCRPCSRAHVLSKLAGADQVSADPEQPRVDARLAAIDTAAPPSGCWWHDHGHEVVIGASTRSKAGAVGALAICLFWNGIVSVFVLIAIAGSLHHAGLSIPSWFPSPVMQGSSGVMPLGMVLFLWLFLTPFILIGAALLGAFLLCLGGRVEARVRDADGSIFTGVGAIGYRQKFDASGVSDVRVAARRWRDSDGDPQSKTEIAIEGAKTTTRFGSLLPEERRLFLAGALRRLLVG